MNDISIFFWILLNNFIMFLLLKRIKIKKRDYKIIFVKGKKKSISYKRAICESERLLSEPEENFSEEIGDHCNDSDDDNIKDKKYDGILSNIPDKSFKVLNSVE